MPFTESEPKNCQDVQKFPKNHNTKEMETDYYQKTFLLKHYKFCFFFATETLGKILAKSSAVLCNGTFKTCPRPFYQISTMDGLKIDRKLPLIWAFADVKATPHYKFFFQLMKSKVGENWEPAQFIPDFERAIHAAVETEVPHSSHKGCYFHFTLEIYRQIEELELSVQYKEDERLRSFTMRLLTTPFLRPKKNMRSSFTSLYH